MPHFDYEAVNAAGQTVKGKHLADTAMQVREHLRSLSLMPLSVEAAPESFMKKRWSLGARVVWMQQLAGGLEARLPLLEALDLLRQQHASETVAYEVTHHLYLAVQQGQSLEYGMLAFPNYFDATTLTIVRSGLASGQLPFFLTDLAQAWEAKQALRQKIFAAALYPLLVGGISVLMTGGLLFYLTPTLEGLFAKRWDQLPWITRVIMAVGRVLREYGVWILLVLVAVIWWGIKALAQPSSQPFKDRFQQWTLSIPVIGELRILLDSARFTHTLGMLLSSGIPLVKALEVSLPSLALRMLKDAIERVRDKVQQGGSLSRAMRHEGVFPVLLVHWAESGERSGALAERLKQAARQLQNEAERRLMLFTSILEPVLILGTGCVVLVLVLAVLLPMTSLQQLVK